MKSIDLDVKTKDEARSFIGECEDVFGQEIDDAIKSLVSSNNTKIVTLSVDLFRKDNNGKKANRTY